MNTFILSPVFFLTCPLWGHGDGECRHGNTRATENAEDGAGAPRGGHPVLGAEGHEVGGAGGAGEGEGKGGGGEGGREGRVPGGRLRADGPLGVWGLAVRNARRCVV